MFFKPDQAALCAYLPATPEPQTSWTLMDHTCFAEAPLSVPRCSRLPREGTMCGAAQAAA